MIQDSDSWRSPCWRNEHFTYLHPLLKTRVLAQPESEIAANTTQNTYLGFRDEIAQPGLEDFASESISWDTWWDFLSRAASSFPRSTSSASPLPSHRFRDSFRPSRTPSWIPSRLRCPKRKSGPDFRVDVLRPPQIGPCGAGIPGAVRPPDVLLPLSSAAASSAS